MNHSSEGDEQHATVVFSRYRDILADQCHEHVNPARQRNNLLDNRIGTPVALLEAPSISDRHYTLQLARQLFSCLRLGTEYFHPPEEEFACRLREMTTAISLNPTLSPRGEGRKTLPWQGRSSGRRRRSNREEAAGWLPMASHGAGPESPAAVARTGLHAEQTR